jgi:hypothetical protein
MILNTHRNASSRLAKGWLAIITSAAALLTVAIIYSAPRVAVAQGKPAPAAANTASADTPLEDPVAGAAVTFAQNAPVALSADAELPATPAPAAVGRGPKFKPGNSGAVTIHAPASTTPVPVVVAAPMVAPAIAAPVPAAPLPHPALPGVAPVATTPFLAAIEPGPRPGAQRAPQPPRGRSADASLEERLERVERMLESLMEQQHPKPGHAEFQLKHEQDWMTDRKEIAKAEALAKRQGEFARRQEEIARRQVINPKEIERIKEHAEREAERAVEQARRATANAEKALKAEQKKQLNDGTQQQLDALRKQLEVLERQREELDRQIEHLEERQGQLEEQQDEDEAGRDTHPEESKAECVADEPVRQ